MTKLSLTDDKSDDDKLYMVYSPGSSKVYGKIYFCSYYLLFFDIGYDGVHMCGGIHKSEHDKHFDLNESGALKIIGMDEL